MAVVIGQAEEIESDGANIRDIWLPLKTSDRLVIEYRKWLDQFGGGLPFYRGFSTFRSDKANFNSIRLPVDRHMLHTRICLTCSKARARLDRLVAILWVFVLLMFGMSQVRNAGQVKISMVLLAFAGLLAVAAARRLKSQFEQGMV